MKSSSMARILIYFCFLTFVSCKGEDLFSKAKSVGDRASSQRPLNNEPSNKQTIIIKRKGVKNQQTIPTQIIQDNNFRTSSTTRPFVNYPNRSEKGLTPLKNTNQKEIQNDRQSPFVPVHRRKVPSQKTLVKESAVGKNNNEFEQNNWMISDFDNNYFFEEPNKDDNVNFKSEKNNILNQDFQNYVKLSSRSNKVQPTLENRSPMVSPFNNRQQTPNSKTLIKHDTSKGTNNWLDEGKKRNDSEPKTSDQFAQSQRGNSSKILDGTPLKQSLRFKLNNFFKKEQTEVPAFADNGKDFPTFGKSQNYPSTLSRSYQKDNQLETEHNQKNEDLIDNIPFGNSEKIQPVSQFYDEKAFPRTDRKVFRNFIFKKDREEIGRDIKENKQNIIQQDEKVIPVSDEDGFASIPLDNDFERTKGYRSFKILYDETFLKITLESLNMLEHYDKILNLVKRMDVYIDNFLKTTVVHIPRIKVKESHHKCVKEQLLDHLQVDEKYFNKIYTVQGDVLIFLFAIANNDSNSIAAAKVCSYHRESLEPDVAIIRFNIPLLVKKMSSSDIAQTITLNVLVHELFHIFGFDNNNSEKFKEFIIEDKKNFPNLAKLNIDHRQIFDADNNAHWSSDILTNDIMTPSTGQDKVLTIFTMEFIEMVTGKTRTRRDYLKNNYLLDRITDFDHYLRYTCKDDDELSEYSNFCTKKQSRNFYSSCDDYFIYRLSCTNDKASNNCYEKVVNPELTCIDENNAKYGRPYESFGDNSRCFMVERFARCLSTSVRDNRVFVSGSFGEKECLTSGQVISINYHYVVGTRHYKTLEITCPDLNKFLTAYKTTRCKNDCYGNGICKEGVCHCLKGFDTKSHCKDTLFEHKATIFVTIPN